MLVCLSKRAFTKESIKEFAAQSATLLCDGLECFTAVQGTSILRGALVQIAP